MSLRKLVAPTVKSMLNKIAPGFASAWQSQREDRHGQKVMRELGVVRVLEEFTKVHGWAVQSGPFAGMKVKGASVGSALIPKLVGSYEQELHAVVGEALEQRYEVIADIGAAEGYYAVGLARFSRIPCAVYAYDINKKARLLCKALANANGVSTLVTVEGRCDAEILGTLVASRRSLVISDCEGFESVLFNKTCIQQLRNSDVIIELHESRSPGVSKSLRSLFSDTHDLTIIAASERDPDKFPLLSGFSDSDRRLALSEFRGCAQQWLIARPRQASN